MKISFDFDGTLADEFGSTQINEQKDKVILKLKELQAENHEIFIVTKRFSPENASKGLVNEHIDVLRLAAELRIPGKNVVFTNRNFKAETLVNLSIDQHFDNSEEELNYFLDKFKNSSMNWILVDKNPWQVFNASTEEIEMV